MKYVIERHSLHQIGEGCVIKKGVLGYQGIECVLIVLKSIVIQIDKNLKLHHPTIIHNRIDRESCLLWVLIFQSHMDGHCLII